MEIADFIRAGKIHPGQELDTPTKANSFTLAEVNETYIRIATPGGFNITIQTCHIDQALDKVRAAGGRVLIGSTNNREAKPGTLEAFLRGARCSRTRTSTYVAPILEKCGIAKCTEGKPQAIYLTNTSAN